MKTTVILVLNLETVYENNFLLLIKINVDMNITKKTEIKDLTLGLFNSYYFYCLSYIILKMIKADTL